MDRSPRSPATLAHGRWRPWPMVSSPMVAGDHGCMVTGFPLERPIFRYFSRFALFGPCDFPKFCFLRHNIRRSSSTSWIRHRNHLIIIGHSETANWQTKKAHFLPDRSRNRLDRCCRPISGNQCLNLHRHPISNNVRIHR